jgi:hypothetical protein
MTCPLDRPVYTNSPTTIIGSEAMIVYLFVQELTGPVPEGLFRYNRRSLCYERIISATQRSLSRQVPDYRLRMKNYTTYDLPLDLN